jgi:glycosyltransferase involved in cell wall biosynthesis
MSHLKLSIIIPAYNVQGWIGQCLDSMIPLNNKEIEIIVINDGSTDDTVAVVEGYKNKFEHLIIYHQENGGASAARNLGLTKATGKYILFCDSDDYIDADEFIKFMEETIRLDVDFSIGNGKNLQGEKIVGVLKKTIFLKALPVLDGPSFYLLANDKKEFFISICTRMYKRDFFIKNNLTFLTGFIHEDEEFAPKAFCLAQKVIYLDSYFYIRRHRLGSVTKNTKHKYYNLKSVPSFEAVLKSLQSFKLERQLSKIQEKVLDHAIHKCILEVLRRELYYAKENVSEMKMSHVAAEQLKSISQSIKMSLRQRIELLRISFKIKIQS